MPDENGKLIDSDLDGFGFRVGHRLELDVRFRRAILETIPEGKGITVYIKEIVVEWDEMKRTRVMDNVAVELTTLDMLDDKIRKLTALELRLLDLEERIKNGQITADIKQKVLNDNEISAEIKGKIADNFIDQF